MKSATALVAIATTVTTAKTVQLLPDGEFRSTDGRPRNAPCWKLNREIAKQLIAHCDASANDLVIDYEHQSLRSQDNGLPAPAAGWFKRLEYREGIGLFATDVRWTANAIRMIESQEYRFLSPVFSYGPNGDVLHLFNAGLTNTPALDGMESVALRALMGSAEVAPVLTAGEMEVCRRMGLSPSVFAKVKEGDTHTAGPLSATQKEGCALSASQRQVCNSMGLPYDIFFKTLKESR